MSMFGCIEENEASEGNENGQNSNDGILCSIQLIDVPHCRFVWRRSGTVIHLTVNYLRHVNRIPRAVLLV